MSRSDLLARVIAYLADAGVGDRSLRQIAAGAGTSHRMLIYHFGTRDALLVEVVRAVEERQRAVLASLRDGGVGRSNRELALEFWRLLSEPALAPYERLFFELYGAALAGQESVAPVLDGIVTSWLTDESMFAGLPLAQARMALAFSRGALLDLLATGDRDGVDAAVRAFVDLVWPSGPPEHP
ncbi:TetR/AcrR family transcriptional regulator [Actinophytocola oryzae]|uniref:TetR family transcriptional regulator n=1 Tax=Actinophytocola oryzae TaxID=502181 RepID=A0A4R7URE8_9PSEU|nr:TetR/AcrR family transcriptional regulator [Actinophytocola oryzae]TDV37608.1 TetR family transcriptional regulator [Actinophytocola oryzae]